MIGSQVEVKIIFTNLCIRYLKLFIKINLYSAKCLICKSFIYSIETDAKKIPYNSTRITKA